MIGIAAYVVGVVVTFGLIEAAARRLFDHVDVPKGDETAPPKDAP